MSNFGDSSERTTCAVCEAPKPAIGVQFGAYACKACAAFFRRAVVRRHQFRCAAAGNCPPRPRTSGQKDIKASGKRKPICRYCRFQRCLRSGMIVTAVQHACLHSVPAHDGTQLGRITAFRKSLFLQRIKAADLAETSKSLLTKRSLSQKFKVEMRVMKEYFANIIAPVRTQYLKDSTDMVTVIEHFFSVWNIFEILLSTMRNKGDVTGSVFYMDETFKPAAQEGLRAHHADTISRLGAEQLMPSMVSTARQIKRSFLDEMALATLFQLVFSRYEKDFFPTLQVRQAYVNDILKDFYLYCSKERQEYSVQMDKITGLLHHFHQTFLVWLEVFTMADLCDDRSDEEKTNDLVNCLAAYRRRKRIDNSLAESNKNIL